MISSPLLIFSNFIHISKFPIVTRNKIKQNTRFYSYFALQKKNLQVQRNISSRYFSRLPCHTEFDYEYLCNKSNISCIKENILKRNSNGDIDKVISLWEILKKDNLSSEEKNNIEKELQIETLKIPNRASPHLKDYGSNPHFLKSCNEKPRFNFKPKEFHKLVENLNLLRIDKHLSLMTGSRSYILSGELADLERALIQYSVAFLLKKGFTLISVPDILYSHIIERCGMETHGQRSQVYHLTNLNEQEICLSGTAEMALGGYFQDRQLDIAQLPLKIAAVSRCYREEVGEDSSEKGIFRVHQFNKVEMFAVSADETGEESQELHQELVDLQVELFSQLGFHFQVLDMPVNELGNPAFKKTDIEAWIPVKQTFGEISSASNCLDYQSRRLNLKYKNGQGNIKYTHTLNGTACATPRLLMAVATMNQNPNGSIDVPEVLQPFMKGLKQITRSTRPDIKHFNSRVYSGTILKPDEAD